MAESEDEPTGETSEELHLMSIEHLEAYHREKARHKLAMKNIDRIHKLARARLKRLYGPVKDRIEADIERQHAERVQDEEERHRTNIDALGKNIRGGTEGQATDG